MPIIDRSYYDAAEKGRQDRSNAQSNLLNQQAARQNIDQRNILNQRGNEEYQAEKVKQFATEVMHAAQYSAEAPEGQTKPFIEKNFPSLVQQYGPDWPTASDEQVRGELQGIAAKFATQAGIGPQQAKGVSGAMYKVVDPQTGEVTYATAQEARGQNPYVYKPPTRAPAPDKRPTPPRGYRYKDDGSVEPIPGGPNDPTAPNRPTAAPKPATEGDKRARVMYFSMKNAEKQLEKVTASDTSDLGQAILGKIPGGRVTQSDEFKRYEAAGLRWAANLLYLKSGATATPDEIRSTWMQFFPQPGDGPSVKAQKDEARAQEATAINDTYQFEKVAPQPPANTTQIKEAPPQAIEYLRQHPDMAEQFKEKYGYLPQ